MATGDILGLKNFFNKNKEYTFFCLVKDPVTDNVISFGDAEFAFNHLKEQKVVERRLSRDWIPVTNISMSKPFRWFVDNTKEVRSFASQMMHYFMGKRQKLGQVLY